MQTRRKLKQQDLEEDHQSITKSHSTQESKRNQLPVHVQKVLAEDIEADGGIKNLIGSTHGLSNLLDKRLKFTNNPYGNRADPLRRRVQQKVYKWQQLYEEGTYTEKVLNKLQIKSFDNQQKRKKEPLLPKTAAESHHQESFLENTSLSSSDSDSSSHSSVDPRVPRLKKKFKSPPKQVQFDKRKNEAPTTPLTAPRAHKARAPASPTTTTPTDITTKLEQMVLEEDTMAPALPKNCGEMLVLCCCLAVSLFC